MKKIFIEVLKIIIGTLFIVSAVMKYTDSSGLVLILKAINIESYNNMMLIIYFIIGFEFVLGISIIFGFYIKKTLYLTIGVFICFTAVLVLIMNFRPELSCGCFGSLSQKTVSYVDILRNLFLIGMSFFLLWSIDENDKNINSSSNS